MTNGTVPRARDERPLVLKSIPFVLVHVAPLGLLWTGMRTSNVLLCVALYFGRMFFITAGFHRYFAHRSYKMGRVMQFAMAWGASTSCQKGVLWWAAHHRAHHRYSDTERDIRWWEIDPSYYLLKLMNGLGLVRDLRTPPARVLTRQLAKDQPDTGMYPELALGARER